MKEGLFEDDPHNAEKTTSTKSSSKDDRSERRRTRQINLIVGRTAEEMDKSITHENPPKESVSNANPPKSGRKKQVTSSALPSNLEYDDNSFSKSNESARNEQKDHGCCKSIGQGIVEDFKQTIGTHWLKEMINFNQKTIAVSFFLFFAAIAPAITFGAIYAKVTNNYIGAVEMIVATAWCGIFYALLGGMPIMINGGTGPVLAFTGVLYKLSNSLDIPFLTFNAWVGLWVCVYMIIAAIFHLNAMIAYATRFTDEIFALLISAIFIIDALGSPLQPVGLFHYFVESHKSHDEFENEQNYSHQATAFLSVIIGLGTTGLAFLLRSVKFSPYFCNASVRTAIADFAVPLAILLFTLLDKVVFRQIDTESLNVPDVFAPTFACCTEMCDSFFPDDCPNQELAYGRRPWIVDLFDLDGKMWIPFLAAVPAVLAFLLVFLDDGITWHLINHPSHGLTHGVAYNYDTLIVGLMIAVNSVLGLPWLVAATVRSLNHLHALGNKTPCGKFIGVQETRLTNLIVHSLVLLSIFFLSIIKLIPVPVLYGIFLYMGLASLGTNQLWDRVKMLCMQPMLYPDFPYTKYVDRRKMHLYTIIQIVLFAILYAVKSIKMIAIAFPLVIAAFIPIRLYALPKIFTKDELILLDDEDENIQELIRTYRIKDDDQITIAELSSKDTSTSNSLDEALKYP